MTEIEILKNLEGFKEILMVGPLFRMDHFLPTEIMPILFIDGGGHFKKLFGHWNSFQASLGDGDSGDTPLDIVYPAEKDQTDLQLALALLPSSIDTLYLSGFKGGRMDHQLAIYGAIEQAFAATNLKKVILGPGHFICRAGSHNFVLNHRFSVLPLKQGELTLTGDCKYQLPKATPMQSLDPRGVSNQGHGTVHVNSTTSFIVIDEGGPKWN